MEFCERETVKLLLEEHPLIAEYADGCRFSPSGNA